MKGLSHTSTYTDMIWMMSGVDLTLSVCMSVSLNQNHEFFRMEKLCFFLMFLKFYFNLLENSSQIWKSKVTTTPSAAKNCSLHSFWGKREKAWSDISAFGSRLQVAIIEYQNIIFKIFLTSHNKFLLYFLTVKTC